MPSPQPIDFGRPAAPRPTATPAPPPLADFAIPAGSPPAVIQASALVEGNVSAGNPITLSEATDFGKAAIAGASTIADKITSIARAGDIDDVGQSLNSLLVTAKRYDPASLKKGGGFLGLFKAKVQELKNQFATVDQQVDRLLVEADRRISLFTGRIGDIEKLYDENEQRYRVLGRLADEFEARIAWMDANLPAADPNDSFSVQHLADWKGAADYARKRVDDMRRGQALCQMNAPMLKMMQSNAGGLVLKFGQIKSDTIPALKQAFALYILNMEMEKGADFATAIDDATNDTLKKNAEKLGLTTVKVQTALARSSIDMSTLQAVQASTLKSLDDAQRIRTEMHQRLQAESPQIAALSQQLAQRLAS